MYGWYNQGTGGGWWPLMMIGMVGFWAVLVIGILSLVRHYGPRGGGIVTQSPTSSSLEILKERFARGELTEEEYTQRRKLLEGK
ncbi:MAG: SHOCT domain-containing protein [Acidimicrobiales bacterium]|nr:SHOCT domain-containing protein [Acidimicrobiales bacterium]